MAFYGYKGDVGECHWTPYSTCTFDYDALLPPPASSYECNEPILIEFSDCNYFDSYTTQPVQNYYAYNLSEPRFIQYEPPPSYPVDSFYSQTTYKISYSTLEFNETEWDDYDPTPYGGGYDQSQTYGKPLPPSDEICYPRSTVQPNGKSLDGFLYAAIPSAYGDQKDDRPTKLDNESKPTDTKEQESLDGDGDNVTEGTDSVEDGDDLEKPLEQEDGDADGYPSSDYGRNGGYVYEWNKQVPYIPYGSGLESLDLCESIFGYWPCLAKIEQQRRVKCQVCDEENRYDPWKSTADYLFGRPFVHAEQKDGGNGNYDYYDNRNNYQYQHQYTQQ